MAQKALFISPTELKRKSILEGLVDDDKILQFIEVAQDTQIHRLLGTDLYNKFQADVIADTVAGDYLTLLNDHIKPMLTWFALAKYLPFSSVQVSNGGVFKRSPENAEAVSKEEINSLVVESNEVADFYTKVFLDYMCANSSLFPEYSTNSNGDQKPEKTYNYCSWAL